MEIFLAAIVAIVFPLLIVWIPSSGLIWLLLSRRYGFIKSMFGATIVAVSSIGAGIVGLGARVPLISQPPPASTTPGLDLSQEFYQTSLPYENAFALSLATFIVVNILMLLIIELARFLRKPTLVQHLSIDDILNNSDIAAGSSSAENIDRID